MMPDERRSVGLYTTVTPEEKALIDEKFMESDPGQEVCAPTCER